MKCNITKESDIVLLVNEVTDLAKNNHWKLWAVVNNAGIADGGALDWTGIDVYRRVMEVNFFGILGVTKGMLPELKRNPGSRYYALHPQR